MSAASAPPYTWTQTKEDISVAVPFATGTTAASISCTVAQGRLSIGLRGTAPIIEGELWDALDNHVWSLEGGRTLTLELEKARPRYWPCVLRGHPEVDVEALKAADKKAAEPTFKPHPDAESAPRRVTDRETLLKLKAEMPQHGLQLEIPGLKVDDTIHKNYSGPRKKFEWGALPTESVPAPAPTLAPPPAAPAASGPSAAPPSARPDAPPSQYSWGATPAAPAPAPAPPAPTPPAPYSWGSVPAAAPAAAVPAPAPAAAAPSSAAKYSWGALPGASAPPSKPAPDPAAAKAAQRAQLVQEIGTARARLDELEARLRALDET